MGSYIYGCRVYLSKVAIMITHLGGVVTPLITSPEPPSTYMSDPPVLAALEWHPVIVKQKHAPCTRISQIQS